MGGISDWLQRERELLRLRAENRELNKRLEKLEAQNDSMRAGMRRCVTCDYRLQVKASKAPGWRDEIDAATETD